MGFIASGCIFALVLSISSTLTNNNVADAFRPSAVPLKRSFWCGSCTSAQRTAGLFMSATVEQTTEEGKTKRKERYEPKWKKKATLAETMGGPLPPQQLAAVGLKGTIPVVFRQGNETKMTMAYVGQPLREVAAQAGQFIKYGCGKGECGTCEALCNGQWIRPCSTPVPALPAGEEYVIQVKEVKARAVSSGKFYSVKSFFLGFWNNFLGVIGMVSYRKLANQNWQERKQNEELIKRLAMEKKQARLVTTSQGGSASSNRPLPSS